MRPKTLVLSDRRCLGHDPGPEHPESPSRLESLLRALDPLPPGADRRDRLREASRAELLRVHAAEYVDRVLGLRGSPGAIDPETVLSAGSVEAALRAAGGCVELVEALLAGEAENGLALVRPPGHHAGVSGGMGYCVFNNLAVAAAHALGCGVERILVVDWDVHHGNGTQEIFEEDPRVLFFSIHQSLLFPRSGAASERGRGRGEGSTLNVPVPPGAGDAEYLAAFADVLAPAARALQPELVLVSAGFDAHEADPMSETRVTTEGFGSLCRAVRAIADHWAGGRLGLVLEGGYDLASLAASARRCVEVLAAPAASPPPRRP
ncbi:MAG: histone deacetylase [Byssovorax sp.]